MTHALEKPKTAEELYQAHRHKVNVNTDRLFGGLMILQFFAGIIAASCLAPRTFEGGVEAVHPHVWAAVVLGALVTAPPIALALWMPGRLVTRYVVSVCQALSSALLIHLSGGRIETHFHVFGSLAFLAFYRDWKILVPATAVTAADHFVRGMYFPQSVFGVASENNWRWLEHAGWVVFEDIFLIGSCVAMTREMRKTAVRTAEAYRKNRVLEVIQATALDCIIGMDHSGRITDFNSAAERTFGYAQRDVLGRMFGDVISPSHLPGAHCDGVAQLLAACDASVLNQRIEITAVRADGTLFPVEIGLTAVQLDGPPIFVAYLRDITDRKKFEREAKHAEMLALVASHTDNAVVITDPRGQIEWVNEGFTRITGYTLAEVVGRKPGDFLQGEETDAGTIAKMRIHLRNGQGFKGEIVNYGKSGRKYWLAMEIRPMCNADGTLHHFMAIESDITTRKAMEQDLRQSRERFELAVRGSSDGLWDWDIVTGAVYFSPAFHEQIGYADGTLPGTIEAFESRVHPDDLDAVRLAIADSHERRSQIYRIEFRFRHRDGRYVWILSRGVTLHDAQGRAIRMAGSHTDITEQKQSAEAVRKAEEKYRGLFENSVLGIFQSTREGRYVSANPAMAKLYGYDTPDHLIGGAIDIGRQHYINPARRAELIAILDREGTVTGFEAEIKRVDGSHRWISKRARVVRDESGAPLYYEGTVEDITEAKAAQVALRQAKDEAEMAQAAAEAASVAKSQFLANMSHEIRTPLNGVIGMADLMLRKGGLTEQQQRYASVIKSSGDSLLSLINDILDFSKIEAGKLELSPIEFDIRSAIEDVVEMLLPKAESKKLSLGCYISRGLPMRLVGDPDRLRQNLINLVNNAIKFTETGQVLIRASVLSRDATQATVKFVVQDTGVGIPKDRLDRLFKSFSQVDASNTRKYGGTGLGLAIVKQLAELMGGDVGVDSTPGQGSSFWFTAKLAIAAPASGEPANRSDLASAIKGLRVLVLDDQPEFLEMIREQLGVWSIDAETCTSADTAMRKLKDAATEGRPYRIAFVDLVTPQGDSEAFLRAASRDPGLRGTSLIPMSAMDVSNGNELSREMGLAACLAKPIRHSALFDALANVVTRTLSTAPAVSSAPVGLAGTLRAHVLLAEDNEVNQEVACGILMDAGCTVDVVNNGAAALAACVDPARRYDIVLMDCQMPKMDGFEATKRVRRARGNELPIIALTANAIAGDRERCLAAGMTDYVSKPIDPDVLIDTMKRLLGARAAGETPAVDAPAKPAETVQAVVGAGVAAGVQGAPLDTAALLHRCRGKADLADRLLRMFADVADKQLAEMKAALEASQWDVFTRLAHTMKGTGSNLSAGVVSGTAAELESLGRAADAASAEAVLARLHAEVRQLLAFIPSALTTGRDAASDATTPSKA